MSYIKKITEQLKNLIAMSHNRFPENKDISMGLTAVETLCYHNRRKLFEIFLTHVYFKKSPDGTSFKELISTRNIDFFLKRESIAIVNLKNTKDSTVINVINGIRDNWFELEEEEKKAIWTYFDVLITLGDKYFIEQAKLQNNI